MHGRSPTGHGSSPSTSVETSGVRPDLESSPSTSIETSRACIRAGRSTVRGRAPLGLHPAPTLCLCRVEIAHRVGGRTRATAWSALAGRGHDRSRSHDRRPIHGPERQLGRADLQPAKRSLLPEHHRSRSSNPELSARSLGWSCLHSHRRTIRQGHRRSAARTRQRTPPAPPSRGLVFAGCSGSAGSLVATGGPSVRGPAARRCQ